jgi:hypothetical protein
VVSRYLAQASLLWNVLTVAKLHKPSAHVVNRPHCIVPAASQRPKIRLRVLAAHAVRFIAPPRSAYMMLMIWQVLARQALAPAIVLTPRMLLRLALSALAALVQQVCH